MIARIGYKVKLQLQKVDVIKINGLRSFLTSYISCSLPTSNETLLNKKNDYDLIKGSSSTCVGYHQSKRLKQ